MGKVLEKKSHHESKGSIIMSVMVISSIERFLDIYQKLKNVGVTYIQFYNAKYRTVSDTRMIARLPFTKILVLGKDASCSPSFNKVVMKAQAKHIPVIGEEWIEKLKEMGKKILMKQKKRHTNSTGKQKPRERYD